MEQTLDKLKRIRAERQAEDKRQCEEAKEKERKAKEKEEESLRTRHNLLEVVKFFEKGAAHYRCYGKRKPSLDGCFNILQELKGKLGTAA